MGTRVRSVSLEGPGLHQHWNRRSGTSRGPSPTDGFSENRTDPRSKDFKGVRVPANFSA